MTGVNLKGSTRTIGSARVFRGVLALAVALVLLAAPVIASAETAKVAPAETAKAPEGLKVEFSHLVLTGRQGAVGVLQLVKLVNSGQKATGPVEVGLPKGYKNLEFLQGVTADKAAQGEAGFVDNAGVDAGQNKVVVLRYDVPATAQSLTFSERVLYPTDSIDILADVSNITMVPTLNPDYVDQGTADMNGKVIRRFTREKVGAGTDLKVNLQLAPDTTAPKPTPLQDNPQAAQSGDAGSREPKLLNKTFHGGNANVMLWQRMTGSPSHGGVIGILGYALVLIIPIVLGVALYRRMKNPAPVQSRAQVAAGGTGAVVAAAAGELSKLLKEKTIVVKKIAELDLKRQSGEVSEEDYVDKRGRLKKRLIQVMNRIKELEA